MSGGVVARHCCGRQGALQSGSGGNKKKNGNNQLEVWQREWWCGGNCHATSLQQAVGSTKWKWRKEKRKR